MVHGSPACRNHSTHDGSTSLQHEAEDLAVPPDGGWGWIVAVASFLIHLITDGITYSFGIFFSELISAFSESNALTSSIASVLVGMTLCSGPVSSSFVNVYGCRIVTIGGAILASFCLFISIFAKNIIYLIFTIGVGCGTGFGLIYLPAIVSVTMYFEKYRSLATGIAVCGSGLGTFVFAPFIEYLVQTFGWRGAMLILSAIILNCIIFGIMFRPLKTKRKNKKNSKLRTTHKIKCEGFSCSELEPLNINDQKIDRVNEKHMQNNSNFNDCSMSRLHSISHDLRGHALENNNRIRTPALVSGTKFISPCINYQKSDSIRPTASQPHMYNIKECNNPDVFYYKSLLNMPGYTPCIDISKTSRGSNRYGSFSNNLNAVNKDKKICDCLKCPKEKRNTFLRMTNFSLFRDIVFIVFIFSNFCTSIGFNIPYVYIAAQAEAINLPKESGSYLLSIIGIANTIGRIVLGYISDKPWINRLLVYNICLTTCGVATSFSIFCYDFTSFAIYSTIYGFTIGAYVGLTSVILVDLLGLDKLTSAFGLLLLFQGIASLVGPPFAGGLYDITKKYEPGFILAGVTITISGLVLFAIPPIQRHRANNFTTVNTITIRTVLDQRVSSI